jgi:hypothetical protein
VISLLKKANRTRITYLIVIAVVIQALGFVTTFAPNALAVVFLPPIPVLNFTAEAFRTSDPFIGAWEESIQELETGPPENNWRVPPGCGETCSFKVQYDAPALT